MRSLLPNALSTPSVISSGLWHYDSWKSHPICCQGLLQEVYIAHNHHHHQGWSVYLHSIQHLLLPCGNIFLYCLFGSLDCF